MVNVEIIQDPLGTHYRVSRVFRSKAAAAKAAEELGIISEAAFAPAPQPTPEPSPLAARQFDQATAEGELNAHACIGSVCDS